MVLECLTWIPHIWGQLVGPFMISKKGPVRPLPDNVTIEILSRLPADCVLKCRRVCRKWRELTSSPYFSELHLERATTSSPSLFLHWLDYDPWENRWQWSFLIYDKAGQKAIRRRKMIIRNACPSSGREMYHSKASVVGSCNGLLMFLANWGKAAVFVFNPITQELITLPTPFAVRNPSGIYFHPSTREYKLLLCPCMEENGLQYYYTYSLKSKVWKLLNYSSSCRTRDDLPRPAILLNGSLHWMVNRNEINNNNDASNHACTDAIMVFGTETEDFRVLPHPGDACYYQPKEHENMHLLGTREHLYLCHVSWAEVIHVWVLEDYACWAWYRRYKVNLNWDVKRFPFKCYLGYSPMFLKPFGIYNGELVISWYERGIFTYNLKKNTVRKVAINARHPFQFASAYTKSLVSLCDISVGLVL